MSIPGLAGGDFRQGSWGSGSIERCLGQGSRVYGLRVGGGYAFQSGEVSELVDEHDLGSCAPKAWEFESPLPHHFTPKAMQDSNSALQANLSYLSIFPVQLSGSISVELLVYADEQAPRTYEVSETLRGELEKSEIPAMTVQWLKRHTSCLVPSVHPILVPSPTPTTGLFQQADKSVSLKRRCSANMSLHDDWGGISLWFSNVLGGAQYTAPIDRLPSGTVRLLCQLTFHLSMAPSQ